MSTDVTSDHAHKVVVADAHRGMRHALASALGRDPALDVVAAVPDVRSAGDALRRHGADALAIDVDLFVSFRLELGPLGATTVIVALGMDRHPRAAARASEHGAHAYVVKERAHLELQSALAAALH